MRHKRNTVSGVGFLGVLAGLFFLGGMFWAKGRDPFERIWFRVKVPGQGKVDCVSVLPKMGTRPLPVVVYLHGSGGSLLAAGDGLRQLAEMGLAAVGMEYCQTNEAVCEAQLSALLGYLSRQRWADTKRMAWVGYSLGAQRLLSFGVRNPDRQPKLLVRLAGGWVPELESKIQGVTSRVEGSQSQISISNSQPATSVLLLHGERDEVFPLSQAERVATCLEANGVPFELRVLPGEGHGLGANRLLVFRVIGEQCLVRLKGPSALGGYRSILAWQAQAKPLWVCWLPALVWVGLWGALRWGPRWGSRGRSPSQKAGAALGSRWWEIGLRWVAAALATAAVAQTALHVVPPRLKSTDWTLNIARKHLVRGQEAGDFEYLAARPGWRGKRLKTLLEHVELANYNRELVNWKLDDAVYRDFVLSAQIDPAVDGELNWRRPLWENFYPRIRREPDVQAAAEIVVRFLRERVTIAQGNDPPAAVADVWRRQITSARGFEAVYVAALRSVGVPARLGSGGRAELWCESAWQVAPRPLMGAW